MYQIKSETLLSYVTDPKIKLPRFQRKQTWKSKDNFALLISVFKKYPIGVSIINKQEENGKTVRFLLDGRQRRNALMSAFRNPINIYDWAKSVIKVEDDITKKIGKIKSTTTKKEIIAGFWNYIYNYLNAEDVSGFEKSMQQAITSGEDDFIHDGIVHTVKVEEEEEDGGDLDALSESLIKDYKKAFRGDLELLLDIILTLHQNKGRGFDEPFNFKKILPEFPNSRYSNDDGKWDPLELTIFIDAYHKYCDKEDLDSMEKDVFFNFLSLTFTEISKETSINTKMKKHFEGNWEDIKGSLGLVAKLTEVFDLAEIGIIETSQITATDSQMIFTLINNSGAKLSAVEILSARPAWNQSIETPGPEIKSVKVPLYNAIGGMKSGKKVVRWDYPATFFKRLENWEFLFGNQLEYENPAHLQKIITLGFKILAGIKRGGVTKEHQDKLYKSFDTWDLEINEIVSELNTVGSIISQIPYFEFLNSFNQNLMTLTSDAVALNFMFITLLDYKRKGSPKGDSVASKNFKHNTIILADKLIFEYVNEKWRGSSDSKIASNISKISELGEQFTEQTDESWKKCIKGINDNFQIDGKDVSFSASKVLVYHVYSMNGISGPGSLQQIDMDHIIPQAKFKSASSVSTSIQNALFNLSPLSMKLNQRKSKRALADIKDDESWLIAEIEKYTTIEKKDFKKYSNAINWKDLQTKRRKIYESTFFEERKKQFNN